MIGAYWRRRSARRALRKADGARDVRDWADAIKAYRRYLRLRPGDAAIWVQLGHMLAEHGDHDGADHAYRRADELNPGDADLILCRGHLARRRSDDDKALEFYRESFALDGNADAEALIAILAPPPPPPVEEEPPVMGGIADGWYEREVSGTLWPIEGEAVFVEFHAGNRLIGQAAPEPGEDGALDFRAILDVELGDNGEGVEVSARRMPDGAPLENSPILLFPPSRHPADHPVAWSVPCEVVKPLPQQLPGEVVLFVSHAPNGRIKPHVASYLRALKDKGLGIVLIVSVDRPLDLTADLVDLVDALIVRRNRGYDFGGWSHALKLYPALYGIETLYLANDSVLAATADGRIGALIDRVRASTADLIGLTESHEWRWHVQSYFLAVRRPLLSTRAFHGFMNDVRLLRRKDHVIRAYEIRLGEIAEQTGHRVEILYPSATALNPTLFGWRELIERGFPFVKVLLLRGQFDAADLSGWREALAGEGFDLALADAVLAAAAEKGPVDDGGRLLAHAMPRVRADGEPLRVAFFGPWNYDNGLGHASRGIIAAIRRTGVRLNLHPIKKPFHVHAPLSPPVDVIDFEGRADIAIVHLNPDSWHLLTDEQRAAIAEADRRIGYWVWEMGHVPPAWRHNFGAVDRVWAPSRYCADLFATAGDAPVDVIPHVVPLPAEPSADPAALRAEFGLAADARTILYVFDGSSYLVRKNPAALVRAFAASGLAARGWSLLLKTKHLHDRPEEGEAFRALAEGTEGVLLIDRPMAADKLAGLMALADIYASPHCSEGFGLTIAEAMACGTAVVATDFGGSRDFLDGKTGWPVKAHRWRLEQDFGHYTEGGEWGRVDEPALTKALLDAASTITAGKNRKGDAARAQVARTLSIEAVANGIEASFVALRAMPRRDGAVPIIANLEAGVPVELARFDADLTLLRLAPDGALDGELPEDLPTDPAQWIVLAPRGTVLSPFFERAWRDAVAERPDVGIFYSDDFAAEAERSVDQLRLKPGFDTTLLAAQDYIGAPLIVRASLLAGLGLRPEHGAAMLDDLLFRAHHDGVSIERIKSVLLAHRGLRPRATADVRKAMLEQQPIFASDRFAPGRAPDTLARVRTFDGAHPDVTLVIPTRRSKAPGARISYVEKLLKAIAEADWPMDRLTVIVGDDIPGTPSWADRAWPFTLRRIETLRAADQPFNYAAKMNRLWRAATTEQIVMMNDDLQPTSSGWLAALIGLSVEEGVGGVGARLLYPDGRLQHAGVAPLFGAVAHVWAERRRQDGTYQDWALVQREWSMVTGALFATRRSLLDTIGGFDEQLTLEYNDIDLCLRLRALGHRILCSPEAEMVHAEKASRGTMPVEGNEYALFHQRWAAWLADDPAWHPGLRHDSFEVMPIDVPGWYR